MMDWNEEAVRAARDAISTVGEAVDTIAAKSTQLEALLVTMMHAAGSDDMPRDQLHSAFWLAAQLAAEIREAVHQVQ